MKTLLLILCLVLPSMLGAQSLIRWSYPGVNFGEYGRNCDEQFAEFTPTTIDSQSIPVMIWDLGVPYKENEIGAVIVHGDLAPGVELIVSTSYNDFSNWWVTGKIYGGDNPKNYWLPFKTYSVKGARYISIQRLGAMSDGELNGWGHARIDCIEVLYATSHVEESPVQTQSVEWSDALGNVRFRGTLPGLKASGLRGVFISRTTKVFIP